MESELFDVRQAFRTISLKGMKKSVNKRYVKQHGTVHKTNNCVRNVMLGKDDKPKRFLRPGDREPLYIMQNGKPMPINNNRHENKKHQPKNHSKIPTQQQWNYMIKKRYMKRKVKELKSKIPSYLSLIHI